MDTSETFIKMCEKAEEIQKLRKDWIVGDVYYIHYCPTGWIAYASIGCSGEDCGSLQDMSKDGLIRQDGETWLPRQDQLQEMIKGAKHMHLLAYEFALYFHGNIDPLYANLGMDNYSVDADNSMEQMWMAFIMKRKYNKIWDNENWKEVTNELDKYTKS